MTRVLICFHAKTKKSARKFLRMHGQQNRECFLSHEFPVIQYFITKTTVIKKLINDSAVSQNQMEYNYRYHAHIKLEVEQLCY